MRWLLLLLMTAACSSDSTPTQATTSPSSPEPSASHTSSASSSASAVASTGTSTPSVKDDFGTLVDLNHLLTGLWVHHEKGDSHKSVMLNDHRGYTLRDGGVRVEFTKGKKGSKTPWNLVFHAPRKGHMGSDNVSGGCGFYEEVNNKEWHTAYCKGYGLKADKGLLMSLRFDITNDGKKLKMRLGSIFDEVLILCKDAPKDNCVGHVP